MDSDARYSALEHGGLEVAVREEEEVGTSHTNSRGAGSDGLIPVPPPPDFASEHGPEVLPGSKPPLERRSSLNQPEVLHLGQYDQSNRTEHGNFYGGESEKTTPDYSDESRQAYIDNHDAKSMDNFVPGGAVGAQKDRRVCGLRRRLFLGILTAVILSLIAAVVGGVCGAVLKRDGGQSSKTEGSSSGTSNGTASGSSASTTRPVQTMSNTGMAMVPVADGSGTILLYFQDSTGRILENVYTNGSWSLHDSNRVNESVVTADATPGTSLSAIAYNINGTLTRQVFFIDAGGLLRSINSTTVTRVAIASAWGAPIIVSSDVASTSGYTMEYKTGSIQEVAYMFNNTGDGWNEMNNFDQSDANSGVACVVYDNADQDEQYVNVHMRNSTTGQIIQNYWSFTDNDGWELGPETFKNMSIPSGTAIAACNDEQQSEYVHFQEASGMIYRGLVDPSGSDFEQFDEMRMATNHTRIGAAFVKNQGAMYTFQNDTGGGEMWANVVSRTLVQLVDEALL
ncbi:hypothetical protein LTR78_006386 [Recurvomyces mirabilis]|uniref:Fucose-specific lectin n=1 Tax=Recurvomyces mirabilis TaxID=574656 RepID=A0AAE0WLA8_9PEZI|nr:hypothetical protein LTR78_006386 [Recurvomyces mirabilis]KAK5152273.1 hypothetical protein LTS14_008650 [Recurvomyces mirabilis]